MADSLTIIVAGKKLSGWEQIEVTLCAEAFPPTFSITASNPDGVPAKAGDPCQVLLGDNLVITGYIDRSIVGGDKSSHLWQLVGRGKTQDLVDCSAEWPTAQLIQGTALSIAQTVAQPYGINVRLANGASAGPNVPQWTLNYTETAASIVQRVAQNAGLLAYEDENGSLLLAAVGSRTAKGGVAYGKNVQSWSVSSSMDQRYSEIVCCWIGLAALSAIPGGDFFDIEKDPNVPRHRRRSTVLEEVPNDAQAFTINKAKWELARRAGRATQVVAEVDSWRDGGGTLWAPNTLVPFDVPGLNLADKTLVLSEVTFRRDNDRGTTATLLAMPREAFVPEPIQLNPANLTGVKGNVV